MLEGKGAREEWDPSWERGMFQPRFRSVTTHTPDPAAQLALPRGLDFAFGFLLQLALLDFSTAPVGTKP
jgi:hypothetical protein